MTYSRNEMLADRELLSLHGCIFIVVNFDIKGLTTVAFLSLEYFLLYGYKCDNNL
jgi:hypothetical protein